MRELNLQALTSAYLAGYGSGSRRKSEELLAAIRELLGIKAELELVEF